MTKIIIMLIVFLLMLSLYIKNKKIIKLEKILIVLALFSIINDFSFKNIENNKKIYLYTAQDFVKYVDLAQKSMKDYGVYASLTLAQAAQEQGLVPKNGYSLFGIKAKGWKGNSFSSVTKEEDANGNAVTIVDSFRTYNTIEDSFDNHGYFLVNEFLNRGAFNASTTLEDQLRALKNNPNAQYATDDDYLCKLVSIINKYDLTKYDEGVTFEGRGIKIIGKRNSNLNIGNCMISGTVSNDSADRYYNVETSYSGSYENGYLFRRFKNEGNVENLASKLENGDANEFISTILSRVQKGLEYHNNIVSGILGNIGEIGSIDAGPYSTWRQGDSRWKSISLGFSSETIGSAGCAATSVAIQIARSGTALAATVNNNLNPGVFVSIMNSVSGFTPSGAIYWAKAANIAPTFKYISSIKLNKSNSLSTIASYLQDSNNYLIAHVYGSNNRSTSNHWVAVTGVTSNDVYMIDPASASSSLNSTYGTEYIDRIVVYNVG